MQAWAYMCMGMSGRMCGRSGSHEHRPTLWCTLYPLMVSGRHHEGMASPSTEATPRVQSSQALLGGLATPPPPPPTTCCLPAPSTQGEYSTKEPASVPLPHHFLKVEGSSKLQPQDIRAKAKIQVCVLYSRWKIQQAGETLRSCMQPFQGTQANMRCFQSGCTCMQALTLGKAHGSHLEIGWVVVEGPMNQHLSDNSWQGLLDASQGKVRHQEGSRGKPLQEMVKAARHTLSMCMGV